MQPPISDDASYVAKRRNLGQVVSLWCRSVNHPAQPHKSLHLFLSSTPLPFILCKISSSFLSPPLDPLRSFGHRGITAEEEEATQHQNLYLSFPPALVQQPHFSIFLSPTQRSLLDGEKTRISPDSPMIGRFLSGVRLTFR